MPLHKVEGRAIHYHIGDDDGDVRSDEEPHHLTFNGTSLEELLERLREETGLRDVIMCSRSPINGKLLPMRLQLPPDNAAVHIVLVQESSTGALASWFISSSSLQLTFVTFYYWISQFTPRENLICTTLCFFTVLASLWCMSVRVESIFK